MDSKILNSTDDPTNNPRHVLRKHAVATSELARLYFEEGLPVTKVAAKVGMSNSAVKMRLIHGGHILRPYYTGAHPIPKAPVSELARLYFNEELTSIEIGKLIGISDETVRKRLSEAGFELREKQISQAMKVWRMSSAERRLMFGDANRATKQAKTKELKAASREKIIPCEKLLLDLLEARGLQHLTLQKAVGIYNMDIATATVGMEIVGRRRHPNNFASNPERIYFILKSGFHIIELITREPYDSLQEGAIDEIIAFLEFVKTLPAGRREYRMIGGSGQRLAVFHADIDNGTSV